MLMGPSTHTRAHLQEASASLMYMRLVLTTTTANDRGDDERKYHDEVTDC